MNDEPLSTRDLAGAEPERATDDASGTTGSAAADRPEATTSASGGGGDREPLLPPDQTAQFTARWQEIQAKFVDEPRDSVAQADALVADLMQRLAAGFSNERDHLEAQWDGDGDVSTEDLRVALTRYRSFFERLLAA